MNDWLIPFATSVLVTLASAGTVELATEQRAAAQAESRITVHVDGMHCATCPITVRVAVGRLGGVRDVAVSLEQARAIVTYDPARVSPAQIVEAIVRAGYHARVDG